MSVVELDSSSVRLGPLLLACTRDHDWDVPPDGIEQLIAPNIRPSLLVERACLHGIESCVYLSVRHLKSTTPELSARLKEAYLAAAQVRMRAVSDLAIVADAFDRAGVPWLAFKGPVLSESVYDRSDLRAYADLDLLVDPADLRDAVVALEAAGGRLLERNWHRALNRMPGEVHVLLPCGTVADLHWHVLYNPMWRRTFRINTSDALAHRRRVAINGVEIPTFSTEDTVLHLALHACRSGGTRLLWSKDLEQAVTHLTLDWDALIERARRWQIGPPVAAMLLVASRTMQFRLDPDVALALSPGPAWRRLVVVALRRSPIEEWTGGNSAIRNALMTTRSNDSASCYALVRRIASLMKSRRDAGPFLPNRDSTHPESILFSSGDERVRDAFFAAVARAESSTG